MLSNFKNFSKDDLTFLRGIEKEGLRTLSSKTLAFTDHPESFGSALTNRYITTDYSESLLEMITPTFKKIEDLINFIINLHIFVNKNLEDNQLLWSASMPCILGKNSDIPIANFGKSNIGKMKHIYRRGLSHRYSQKMQSIAGLHYNFSFSDSFWKKYAKINQINKSLKQIKNDGYFALIRNVHRYSDLLIYLFSCSPVADKSFLKNSQKKCITSIRISEFGYTSNKQKLIKIYYNNLKEYNETLIKFIKNKDNDYQKIGKKINGKYCQLNESTLQIENEFYNIIRPKRSTGEGKSPSQKLKKNGVEYIELRLLDINVFSSIGITKEQLYFLDIFLLFCINEPSPLIDDNELNLIEKNRQEVINSGCKKNLTHIYKKMQPVHFKKWSCTIFSKLSTIAKQIDEKLDTHNYKKSIDFYNQSLSKNNNFSNQLKNQLKETDLSFVDYINQKNQQYKRYFLSLKPDLKIQQKLKEESKISLQKQLKIEKNDNIPFNQFLEEYYQSIE